MHSRVAFTPIVYGSQAGFVRTQSWHVLAGQPVHLELCMVVSTNDNGGKWLTAPTPCDCALITHAMRQAG